MYKLLIQFVSKEIFADMLQDFGSFDVLDDAVLEALDLCELEEVQLILVTNGKFYLRIESKDKKAIQ